MKKVRPAFGFVPGILFSGFCVLGIFGALALSVGSTSAQAQDANPAAATNSAENAAIPASDLEKLRPLLNTQVTVEGTIADFGNSKSGGVRYLNFDRNWKNAVGLVIFPPRAGAGITDDELKAYVGKKVEATGKLNEFKGNLQIKIESLEQLKVLP